MSFLPEVGGSQKKDPPTFIEYDFPRGLVILFFIEQVNAHYAGMPAIIPRVVTFVEDTKTGRIIARYKPENDGHKLIKLLKEAASRCDTYVSNVLVTQRYSEEAALNVRVISCVVSCRTFSYLFAEHISNFLILLSTPEGDETVNVRIAFFSAPNDQSFEQKITKLHGEIKFAEVYGIASADEVGAIINKVFSGLDSPESKKPVRNIRVRDGE